MLNDVRPEITKMSFQLLKDMAFLLAKYFLMNLKEMFARDRKVLPQR
jgi:hypothetical protein